jgi:hypothetical protein
MSTQVKIIKPRFDRALIVAFTFVALAILAVVLPYYKLADKRTCFGIDGYVFRALEYDKLAAFISSITAPFLSLSVFILLFFTYKSQKEELNETREIMKRQASTMDKQQFETTFFNMLNLHQQLVNYTEPAFGTSPAKLIHGRDCFARFYQALITCFHAKVRDNQDQMGLHSSAYMDIYNRHQSSLGHYFRYLYHLVKFIDRSDVNDKKQYTSLIRATLSSNELLLVFYNGLNEHGLKFKPLIERYQLLKNMPFDKLLDVNHKLLYTESAYNISINAIPSPDNI